MRRKGESSTRGRWRCFGLPLALLTLYLASEAALVAAGHPAPCLFRLATGIPCPTCGSTRAALRLLHLDPWGALTYNPLLVLSLLLLVAAGARGLLRRRRGQQAFPPLRRPGLLTLALVLALLANWVYVIKAEKSRIGNRESRMENGRERGQGAAGQGSGVRVPGAGNGRGMDPWFGDGSPSPNRGHRRS